MRNLIIITIPFYRLLPTRTSPQFTAALQSSHVDILYVLPRNVSLNTISGDNLPSNSSFLSHSPLHSNRISTLLFNLLKLVRFHGFWFSQPKAFAFYLKTRHLKFKNGQLIRLPLFFRIAVDLFSLLGVTRNMFTAVNSLISPFTYNIEPFKGLSSRYNSILLLQSASWGEIDSCLAYASVKYNWTSILIPYSTDQLYANGWLQASYRYVCTQSVIEYNWASQYHLLPPHRLVRLGSLSLSVLKSKYNSLIPTDPLVNLSKPYILYSGLDPAYFPRKCELECLTYLSSHPSLQHKKLIYRPIKPTDEIYSVLEKSIKSGKITVTEPHSQIIDTDHFSSSPLALIPNNLVSDLCQTCLIVSSVTSSLSIDAALFGIPTISYLPLSQLMDSFSSYRYLSLIQDSFPWYPHVPVAKSLVALVDEVNYLLDSQQTYVQASQNLLSDWDFPSSDPFLGLRDLISNTLRL